MSDLSFFQHKNVLVTGGAGFIGSHLCEELLQIGAYVTAVDNLLTGNRNNIASFEQPQSPFLENGGSFTFIEADVCVPAEQYLPAGYVPDVVLHFASPASPPRYQAHPVETYLVNSIATHYLLSYLKHAAPQARFLFASTSEVYGDPLEHPQTENYWGNVNPNGIRSCYDEAKRLGETICGVHFRDFGLDTRIVRIFNTYGPRMNIEDGRVIPDFIKQSLADQPLFIHGDGTQTRSYCYVKDLVRGILVFATAQNLAGETINIGNPGEFTILETAKIIFEQLHPGKSFDPTQHATYKPLPKDDPLRRQPNIEKAKQLLSWGPQVEFQEGLRSTITFFQQK